MNTSYKGDLELKGVNDSINDIPALHFKDENEQMLVSVNTVNYDYQHMFNQSSTLTEDILNVSKDAQFVIPTSLSIPTVGTANIIYEGVLISQLWKEIKELLDRLHAVEVSCANITSEELEEATSGSEAEELVMIKNKYKTVVPSE